MNLGPEVMAMQDPRRQPIPISQRRVDLLFVAFFLLNFGFITYVVDLEQLVIARSRPVPLPPVAARSAGRSGPLVRGSL